MDKKELGIREAFEIAVRKHNQGDFSEAEYLYKKILEVDNNPDAWHLLGLIDFKKKNYKASIEKIRNAIKLKPSPRYYYNLGMIYGEIGNEEESAECYLKFLDFHENHAKKHIACYNLGIYYQNKGELDKAIDYYDKSIELNSNFSSARLNKSSVLLLKGKLDKAIEGYDEVIKLKKSFDDAKWNKSLILLLLGRLREGFEDYECRFSKKESIDKRIFQNPRWNNEDLFGKRILVLSEQGFGDDIQFVRYLKLVKDRGGYIIFECKKELRKLFESVGYIDEFVEKEKNKVPEIEFHYYIHLMSLPYIFNTSIESIPKEDYYLKADEKLKRKFREKLNSDKFKVGICWRGNPQQENDKNRSLSFEYFKDFFDLEGVEFFSLQKDNNEEFDDERVIDLSNDINDFSDTAAIIENLDLIISVDTSVAHLAGALGKECWVLLTYMPSWRWFLERSDSPWYPNMKLFRQKELGNWEEVIEGVKEKLRKRIEDKGGIIDGK